MQATKRNIQKLSDNLTLQELNDLEAQIQKKKAKLTIPKKDQEKIIEDKLKPVINLIKEIKDQEINIKLTFKLANKKKIIECLSDLYSGYLIDFQSDNKVFNKNFIQDGYYEFIELVPGLDKHFEKIDKELDKLVGIQFEDENVFKQVLRKLIKEM